MPLCHWLLAPHDTLGHDVDQQSPHIVGKRSTIPHGLVVQFINQQIGKPHSHTSFALGFSHVANNAAASSGPTKYRQAAALTLAGGIDCAPPRVTYDRGHQSCLLLRTLLSPGPAGPGLFLRPRHSMPAMWYYLSRALLLELRESEFPRPRSRAVAGLAFSALCRANKIAPPVKARLFCVAVRAEGSCRARDLCRTPLALSSKAGRLC